MDCGQGVLCGPQLSPRQFAFYPFSFDATANSESVNSDLLPKLYSVDLGADDSLVGNDWPLD
jgi:hypothetical protein